MKMITLMIGLFFASAAVAQSSAQDKAVKKIIQKFAASADIQDANALDEILDPNFRVVMNQLFGSTELIVMDKPTYLGKIKAREFGGDPRKIEIKYLEINGKTATAKVTFKGSKLTFTSFLQLTQDHAGQWKLISDMPTIS